MSRNPRTACRAMGCWRRLWAGQPKRRARLIWWAGMPSARSARFWLCA